MSMVRCAVLLAFLIIGCGGPIAAAEPILAQMSGVWVGDQMTITLDGERMQANLDKELPFQREPLILKNIAGSMVVFEIGKRRFIGLFKPDELSLTGDGLAGSVTLRRLTIAARTR